MRQCDGMRQGDVMIMRGQIRIEVIFESYMIWDMKYDNLGLDYDIICIVRDVMS